MKKPIKLRYPSRGTLKFDLKMRLTTFLIVVSLFQIQANTYSQNTRVSLDLINVPVEEVINVIEKKTEFKFLLDTDEVDLKRIVTVQERKQKIHVILDKLFKATNIVHSVLDTQIILKPRPVERTTAPPAETQEETVQNTVTGTVTDNNGSPLPGANIIIVGTQTGVVSDFDGNFSIEANEGDILEFSYLGMETIRVTVDSSNTMNVAMNESSSALDEVVITALGIKKDAKALGYSVAKVDNERILASGTPANALQSLYGTAAGVQVAGTANGPAGGMKINIRNSISLDNTSTTRPLIVVDGVPIHDENSGVSYNTRSGRDNGTGINDINPDDIASFEILKGAKASVLYGSEGANGVILITTKSGAKGKGLGVSASFTTTMDSPAFMPELQRVYGTGRSPSTSITDDQGYYLDENGTRALDFAQGAWGPKFDPNVSLLWWDGSTKPWAAHPDGIYDQLFQTGNQNTTNVALTGGGEKGNMRFSYTNMDLTPMYPNGKYTKNTFSLSSTYELNDHITLKYSGNYYLTNNLNSTYAGSFDAQGARSSLGAFAADIDVSLLDSFLVTDDGYNYFSNPDNRNLVSNGRSSIIGNLWDWKQNESDFERIHNIQSLTLDIKLNDTFSASILGGLDNTQERNIYKGKLLDPSLIGPNSGMVLRDVSRNIRRTYGQGLLNFNTKVNDDWGISGFVGGVIRHNESESKGAERIGNFVIPNFFSFRNLPSGEQPVYNFNNGEDKLYSLVGSVQFDWKDQLFIEAQGRQDWSSILPPGNNSFFYPGVSASWILSNSFELPEYFKFLKLRTSWADVGRPGSRYFSNVNLGVSQSGGGFILSPPGDLPPIDENLVPNLKPEKKREYEVGLEAYLFKDRRLGVDFSYYNSSIYDQIMKVPAPPGWGVSNIRRNAGEVDNIGWELALKTKPIHGKDFKWGLDLAFSSSKTIVRELFDDLTSLSLWSTNGLNAVAEVGGEYGMIIQNQGFQNYINPSDDNDPNNGELVVANSGNRYNYNRRNNRKVGKLLPDVVGGAFNSFTYKNFRLVANIDYSFGATFISETETYMMASGMLEETLRYRDAETGGVAYHLDGGGAKVAGTHPSGGATFNDGVVLSGVRTNGDVNDRVAAAEDYYYDSYFSNGFFPVDRIFKSDYVALRNVALDYTLPGDVSEKIGMKDVTLSVFANNLAYIYKDAPNSNPESTNGTAWSQSATGTTALPSQRSLGMSVKVKL